MASQQQQQQLGRPTMTTTTTTRAYEHGEPLAKRRRISLACTACRVRKSRCDGQRPFCSACSTLRVECQYEPADSSANVLVPKELVSNLEQRLKDVERALQRHDDLLTGHLSRCWTPADRGPPGPQNDGDHLSLPAPRPAQDGIQLDVGSEEQQSSDEAKTDGLAIVFVDDKDPEFYGETSNIVFIRFLLRAFPMASNSRDHGMTGQSKGDDGAEHNLASTPPQTSPSAMDTPKNTNVSPSALPTGEEMDALLDTYFNVYGSLFPFIYEPAFRNIYDEYKASGFTKVVRPWLGLLNMTFAMASNADQSVEVSAKERFRKSHTFFMRAESLCGELSMRTVSLDIVQYLLLTVLYLQGTQRSVQAWNVQGVLVRTAIALGLHTEKSAQGLDPIQQEVRRRTWLTIYCLDNLLSVTFGRLPSIPVEHIAVQLPSAWRLTGDISQRMPSSPDINTEFLNATVRLHQIMGRSVADQYGMNLGLAEQDMDGTTAIQAANTMGQALRRWTSSLPPELSLCEPDSEMLSESTDSNRLRVILTLRYHFASILIHRPLLYATLRYLTTKDKPAGKDLPYRIQLAMAEAQECIRSAESTIEVVYIVLGAQKTGHNNLGVWFFTLFYVFTSSLVVLCRSVLAQHGVYANDAAPSKSVRSLLTKAVESLDRLDKGNHLVYNCAKFIRHLSERQNAPAEQHDSRYSLNDEPEGNNAAYYQSLPVLVGGDLDMAQSSILETFDPFLGDFNFDYNL